MPGISRLHAPTQYSMTRKSSRSINLVDKPHTCWPRRWKRCWSFRCRRVHHACFAGATGSEILCDGCIPNTMNLATWWPTRERESYYFLQSVVNPNNLRACNSIYMSPRHTHKKTGSYKQERKRKKKKKKRKWNWSFFFLLTGKQEVNNGRNLITTW